MVDHLHIRPMTVDDIAFGLSLGEIAGWNQLEADWLRIYRYQPDGCFVAEREGNAVGTITTTSYGTELAWIGMMLVHPEARRQGIATALMNHAIQYLESLGTACIKLDATPEGAKVYRQLGFHTEWEFHRYERIGNGEPHRVDAENGILITTDLDTIAFGVDRLSWLQALTADSKTVSHSGQFAMLRSGRKAGYLGPVVARDSTAARHLIEQALAGQQGRIFWDAPGPNRDAVRLTSEFDFDPVRDLTRMWRGSRCVTGALDHQFGLASPATG